MTYRVGNHQPQNVYRDDRYIGVMFDPEVAAEVVVAMNERAARYGMGTPYPGEKWRWPTECARCYGLIGPWNPAAVGSGMTHIRDDGGADFESNQDHAPVTEVVHVVQEQP